MQHSTEIGRCLEWRSPTACRRAADGVPDVGLLKSRKDAAKEFERYVDAVEHPPEVDDYVEEEELGDQDTILPTAVSVAGDRGAARRAPRRSLGTQAVPEPAQSERPADRRLGRPERRKRLGEVLVDRGAAHPGAARGGAHRSGRLRASASASTWSTPASSTSATSRRRSPTSSGSRSSTCARAFRPMTRSRHSPRSTRASWLAIPLRRTEFGYDVAVADPSEPALVDQLRDELHQPAKLYVAGVSDVRRAIDVAYKATSRVGEHVRVFEAARPGAARRSTSTSRSARPSTRTRPSSRS